MPVPKMLGPNLDHGRTCVTSVWVECDISTWVNVGTVMHLDGWGSVGLLMDEHNVCACDVSVWLTV